jgi:hypothetical protein
MSSISSTISPSPDDFQDFGGRLACHRTLLPESGPEHPFMQVLRAYGSLGPDNEDLRVLLWHFAPTEGVYGAWFDVNCLREAIAALEQCRQLEPSQWRLYITTVHLTPDIRLFDNASSSLQELVSKERQ